MIYLEIFGWWFIGYLSFMVVPIIEYFDSKKCPTYGYMFGMIFVAVLGPLPLAFAVLYGSMVLLASGIVWFAELKFWKKSICNSKEINK